MKAAASMTPAERFIALRDAEARKIERYNAEPGHLNETDGYDCPKCKNRGSIGFLDIEGDTIHPRYPECSCMAIRRSILRMKASGLENSIKDYTFKRFNAREPWQQKMVDMARRYLAEGVKDGRWLFIGGQPGCGKTHVCTAVAGKLLYEKPLLYVVWPQISKKLKAIMYEAEEYEREIGKVETTDVLYIDDLFKQELTAADIRLAYELISGRCNARRPTILSSERDLTFIRNARDGEGEAIAGRIFESCGSGKYCFQLKGREKNLRFGRG
jgi:DNA replication protein DnaC